MYCEIVAFSVWRRWLTPTLLRNNVWTECFAKHAANIDENAETQAERASTARFYNWLHEGPAAGLGRQHKLSRVAIGWITSRSGPVTDDGESAQQEGTEDEVMNGLSAERLAEAIAQGANTMPLSAQQPV